MTPSDHRAARAALFVASALSGLAAHGIALGAEAQAPAAADASSAEVEGVVVTAAKTTRSAVLLSGAEIQKILPGVNPLKAIEALPGVMFQTADPWGNDEQNESVFVHGFTTQQLGYTFDNVPLGDQQYGNYNGLSPSRAVSSENVSKVELSSGAGGLGVASTSNLGGAIETFSRDPSQTRGADLQQTLGSYNATRSFLRLDTGDFGGGNSAYVSYLHQDAKAWDFHGHQRDDQVNLKYKHADAHGDLTVYLDWQNKVDPNEDATGFGNQQTAAASAFIPYTRPYLYPNLAAATANVTNNGVLNGTPPASQGNNFSNYFSAEQRQDLLGYVKYDYKISDDITWSNQAYYHYDYGRGIVAGPVNQAGLPGLFAAYFPNLIVGGSPTSAGSLQNLVTLFGGTGYEVRTTEYHINRYGGISTLDWTLGQHQIEAGLWYEHNSSGQHRVWYPVGAANDDLTPYSVPTGQVFTQDAVDFTTNVVQTHIQDQWRILPPVLLQAGFKSSLQTASNDVLVQQQNTATNKNPTQFPTGSITSNIPFLPEFGAVWDITDHEQAFANIQQNVRQFIPYSQGGNFYGTAPWSLGNQAAFNLFKQTVHPESSWTYEVGVRTQRPVEFGILTSIQGQANYYHVDFSNRILNVAPYNFINPAPSILVNVGGVTTDGVDIAGTLNFGTHFHAYDGLSYNRSVYDQNYNSGTTNGGATPVVIPIAGKLVPGEPEWLNKTILSTNFGPFEAQVTGDYVGKRYATYLNDLSVKSTFLVGLQASYLFDVPTGVFVQTAKLSVNATNIGGTKGVSTLVTTGASGGYQAFPIAPSMYFVTMQVTF